VHQLDIKVLNFTFYLKVQHMESAAS